MEHSTDSILIDQAGGTGAVAKLCEVSSQAVSKWRRTGIPRDQRKYLRLALPDVFDESIVAGDGAKAHTADAVFSDPGNPVAEQKAPCQEVG